MPKAEFPVSIANFDQAFTLPEFPDYYECQACMSLIPDILECPSCSAKACRTCSATHTEKHKTQKPADFPNPTYSKCLLCNKIVLMKNSHRFMKELLLRLNFHCKNCQQDIAYQNFNAHMVNGVCQRGSLSASS